MKQNRRLHEITKQMNVNRKMKTKDSAAGYPALRAHGKKELMEKLNTQQWTLGVRQKNLKIL